MSHCGQGRLTIYTREKRSLFFRALHIVAIVLSSSKKTFQSKEDVIVDFKSVQMQLTRNVWYLLKNATLGVIRKQEFPGKIHM